MFDRPLLDSFSYLFIIGIFIALASFICPQTVFSQNHFENELRKKMDSLIAEEGPIFMRNQIILPNNSVQSIMTPSGWGGGNTTYIFGVIGGAYPSPYSDKADLISVVGLNFGNPEKWLSVSASVNITRVTELRDLSMNIILSRSLGHGNSISAGALQILASASVSDSPDGTYFAAFSHSVQTVPSKTPGYSGLGYTIGFGTGRFLYKSPLDIASGKGKYGTGVFANVSYEIIKNVNINAEWSGMNLGFSSGVRPIKNSPLTFGFGIYNFTKYSGDGLSYIGSLGYPISLDKKRQIK